jgi:hypothetical protein
MAEKARNKRANEQVDCLCFMLKLKFNSFLRNPFASSESMERLPRHLIIQKTIADINFLFEGMEQADILGDVRIIIRFACVHSAELCCLGLFALNLFWQASGYVQKYVLIH